MKEKETLFYCYNCPTSRYYAVNGYTYWMGEDFRSARRYKEYVDCGFNMVQARGENSYKGEEWEGSNCQLAFREALKGAVKNPRHRRAFRPLDSRRTKPRRQLAL